MKSYGKTPCCFICKQQSIVINRNGTFCTIFKIHPDFRNHFYCMPCLYDLFYEEKQNRIIKNNKTYIKRPCDCDIQETRLGGYFNSFCVICGLQPGKQQDQIIFNNDGRFYCKSCQKRMKDKYKTFKCLPKMKAIIEKIQKENQEIQKELIKKQSKQQNSKELKRKQEEEFKNDEKFKKNAELKNEEERKKRESITREKPKNKEQTGQKQQQQLMPKKTEIVKGIQRKQSNLLINCQKQQNAFNSPRLNLKNEQSEVCFCISCKQGSKYLIKGKQYQFQFYKDTMGHHHCQPCLYKEYHFNKKTHSGVKDGKKFTANLLECKCGIQTIKLQYRLSTRCIVCGIKQPKSKINLSLDRFYCITCKQNITLNLLQHKMLNFIKAQIDKMEVVKYKPQPQNEQIFQDPLNREDQFQSVQNRQKNNAIPKSKTNIIDKEQNIEKKDKVRVPKINKHLQDLEAFLNQHQKILKEMNSQKQKTPIYIDLSLISWNQEDPDYSQVFNTKQKPVIFQKFSNVNYTCGVCKQKTPYRAYDKMCKNCFYKDIFQGTNFKFKNEQSLLNKSKSDYFQNEPQKQSSEMNKAKIRQGSNYVKSQVF